MTDDQHSAVDPTTKHSQPATGGENIPHPGLTGDMSEAPDHGEDSYRGSGKLKGRKAVITGGPVSAERWRWRSPAKGPTC